MYVIFCKNWSIFVFYDYWYFINVWWSIVFDGDKYIFFFMFYVYLVSLCIVLNNGLFVFYKNNKFDEIIVILKMERAWYEYCF